MTCVVTRKPHRLEVIASQPSIVAPGAKGVVRWCCDCGAVVVDVDVDGRTHPGGDAAMRFPALAVEAARKGGAAMGEA